ncbi:MAG TPA: penicillin-binding transpeptidase domain-containing protein [Methylomirabilota bacterium]|jgi:cell division protein FtsI (penicillin-binding protein 3)|nr:penicillin-binding transpeptidase domain-containing protein [Methylomirabilota bacterium]
MQETTRFRSRALVLTGVLFAVHVVVVARLGHLQLLRRDELGRFADRQYSKTIPLRPKRGPIFDRHGQVLAVSTEVESVFADPRRIPDRADVAARLAPLLGEGTRELEERLRADRPFVWVKRQLPPPVAQAVRALGLPGIGLLPESLRVYPNRELAAHVLGFDGVDDRGLGGIELAHDRLLAGAAGLALVERDALGRDVTAEPRILKPPTPGQGLILTLDATIQYVAERELDAAWRRTGAQAGMILAMDPRTGELLALAVRPTFNPNVPQNFTAAEWRNRAISDPFEPGSTFKAILAAAALEEAVMRPDDRLYAEQGVIMIANRPIHDWKRYGWLSFREVLQYSSNVGAIKVGLAVGRDRYYKYMTAFGFGTPTGVGLPGESRGQLRPPQRWSGLSLASMAIGQEVSVTALQMLSAFAAIANDGRLMQPHVVRAVLDQSGREVRRVAPEAVRQVVSSETAATLRGLLTTVVAHGTGARAAVGGYAVAGKTGTAQKLDPGTHVYSRRPGVLSFVGFAPADAPRLAMFVMLDEPKTVAWGSEAAAPIFAAVAGPALRYLGIPPADVPSVPLLRAAAEPAAVSVPLTAADGAEAVMPDLVGRSLRQALTLLAGYDVEVAIAGRGVVVRQTPAPGAALAPGAFCRLELAPPATAARGPS